MEPDPWIRNQINAIKLRRETARPAELLNLIINMLNVNINREDIYNILYHNGLNELGDIIPWFDFIKI